MALPLAPKDSGGDKILFVIDNNGGVNRANLLRGYKNATLNAEQVAEVGVYPTSGSLVHGNRNAVNTSQLQLITGTVPCQGVLIKARRANANDVWVGANGLTAGTTESTGGWRLEPGESVGIPCRNANEVYLRWATYTAGDGVEWIGERRLMGWLVKNISAQSAHLLQRDGTELDVAAGDIVEVMAPDGREAVRTDPATWERIVPSDPEYIDPGDR